MSYEQTEVPVSRSQEGIRKLVLGNGGTGVAFISQPPREGFEAHIPIDGKVYHIRIAADCIPRERKRVRQSSRYGHRSQRDPMEAEARRVWRVLFYNLKSTFESANSKVMELRELMLSYIVTNDGRTIAERILPRLAEAIEGNTVRLLTSGANYSHGVEEQ